MTTQPDSHEWQKILRGLDVSDVPVYFYKKLVVKKFSGRKTTINITALFRQGLTSDECQLVVARQLEAISDEIKEIEPHFDVELIASIIEPEAERLTTFK